MAASRPVLLLFLLLSLLLDSILAHSGEEETSAEGVLAGTERTTVTSHMRPYLHFTSGDTVWFKQWIPHSVGAIIGTSIGFFLLAFFSRWLAAFRAITNLHWREQLGPRPIGRNANASASTFALNKEASMLPTTRSMALPSFSYWKPSLLFPRTPRIPLSAKRDIARGLLQGIQYTIDVAFMLVIMTYQAAFIIAIIVGVVVGEILFGRYNI